MDRAVGAQAPERDLGLVDDETMGIRDAQTWSRAVGTIDVGDSSAIATYDVMVVVADPHLKQCRRAGGFDASSQAHVGQSAQYVIDGLRRNSPELTAHLCSDAIDFRMR